MKASKLYCAAMALILCAAPVSAEQGKDCKAVLSSSGHSKSLRVRKADLRQCDLSKARIAGAEISGRLARTDFQESDLANATLTTNSFKEASFNKADLARARISSGGEETFMGDKMVVFDVKCPAIRNGGKFAMANGEKSNFVDADLTESVLRLLYLKEANLDGAKLTSANLEQSHLQDAKLKRAKLNKTNLREACLKGASLEKAVLSGANLSRAGLQGAKLKDAVLYDQEGIGQGGNLDGADLEHADLSSARISDSGHDGHIGPSMTGINLKDAVLTKAQVIEATISANLMGARFTEADLSETTIQTPNFRYADFTKASLKNARIGPYEGGDEIFGAKAIQLKDLEAPFNMGQWIMTNGEKARFDSADMEGFEVRTAYLKEASFRAANLGNASLAENYLAAADFKDANLRGTRFERSYLGRADFRGAKLEGADFSDANLSEAIWTDGRKCAAGSIGKCK